MLVWLAGVHRVADGNDELHTLGDECLVALLDDTAGHRPRTLAVVGRACPLCVGDDAEFPWRSRGQRCTKAQCNGQSAADGEDGYIFHVE